MKKILIITIALLVFCDVSLLFAAQATDSSASDLAQLTQLQQAARRQSSAAANLQSLQEQQRQLLAQGQSSAASQAAPAQPAQAPASQAATPPTLRSVPPVATASGSDASGNAALIGASKAIDAAAFESVTSALMPMTPSQIKKFRHKYNETQRAAQLPVGTPPKPTSTSRFVSLAPGTTPPVVRLSQGFVSSLVFLDSTGAPWPIANYDLGNPSAFNIQWDKKSNALMVQANALYTYGNLAVRLQDLNTPVMLTLIPGQSAVDYRVDLRIQGYGPNAKRLPTGRGLPESENPVLLSVLDGVPPPNSKLLRTVSNVEGSDLNLGNNLAQVWQQGNQFYVRTRMNILSPGWISTMSSADGTHVFLIPAAPVILLSAHGQVVQLKVEGL